MRKQLYIVLAVLFCALGMRAQNVVESFYETDGQVNATLKLNNKLFIGGSFSYLGPSNGALGAHQVGQNQLINSSLKINGIVNAMLSDNNGNIYLGGRFSINGNAIQSVAKISNGMTPDLSFQFNFDGEVNKMVIHNNVLIVAGSFNSVNSTVRSGVAGIDLTLKTLSSFAPNPDGKVNTLYTANGTLVIGGSFSYISGNTRSAIAVYDVSRNLLPLNLAVKGSVQTIGLIDSLLFIGGKFDTIAGVARKNMASVNLNTTQVRSWKADVIGTLNQLAFSGNNIYLAGNFYQVGTEARNHLASVNIYTGTIQSFNPGFDDEINSIHLKGNTLFAGGKFHSVGMESKNYLAAVSIPGGAYNSNLPIINGEVNAMLSIGDTLLYGGNFSSFGGKNVNNFAVLNRSTGQPVSSFTMDINGTINDLVMVGSNLLVAGDFSFINNDSRIGVAILDTATGVPASWDVQSDGPVRDAFVSGTNIYLAGEFTSFGLTQRNYLAVVDASTGSINSWNPSPNGIVRKLLFMGSQMYAIGDFNKIGTNNRSKIASFDLGNNRALRSWNVSVDSTINDINTSGNKLLIAGLFQQVGGISKKYVAALDTGTAAVSSWSPVINGEVQSIEEDQGLVFVGGKFVGNFANGFTCFSISSNTELNFPVKPSMGSVNKLVHIENQLFLSGDFTLENGKKNYAALNLNVSVPTTQASILTVVETTTTSMKFRFKPGNAAKYLVLAKEASIVDTFPSNGLNYTANAVYGSGQNIGSSFIVYNGTDTNFTVSGLNPGTVYHFAVFAYNGFSSNSVYLTANPARNNQSTLIGYNPPTTAASNIQFAQIDINQMMVKWTKGNGSGRYVVAREASAVNLVPLDSTIYNSSQNFGFGDDLGQGNFLVYNGTGDSTMVTGLKSGVTYHYKVFEYNGIGQFRRVLATAPSGNATTVAMATEPSNAASNLSFPTSDLTSIQLNWTNGNGSNRIVVASLATAVTTLPVDGETYYTDNTFNGASSALSNHERVVYIGNGNQASVSGLNPNTMYHFAVFEYNGTGTLTNYKTNTFLAGNKSTKAPIAKPTLGSKNIVFNKIGSDSISFSWTPGNGDKRLVYVRKNAASTAQPESNKTYTASAVFGNGDSLSDGSFIVMDGTSSNLVLTGLTPKTNYYLSIVEYNVSGTTPLYNLDSIASANVLTLPASGINKVKENGKFSVYPNPVTTGYFDVSFEKGIQKDVIISLFNISGELIYEVKPEAGNSSIFRVNTQQLSSGDYILQIVSGKDSYSGRINIQ